MKENLSNKIKVIAVVGPTASGKTSYSIELAKKINGEIVSADSRLVYKNFNIGTAKPAQEEMDNIPHHMIDIVEPTYEYTAGLYKQQASKVISNISSRGKTPIVVGGTGLYVDILLKGYTLPVTNSDKSYRKILNTLSNEELFVQLSKNDPQAAENIAKNDRNKIIRALEIINDTGCTLGDSRGLCESEYDVEWIGKNFSRDILYERINNRVDIMIDRGLIDEVKKLIDCYGHIYNLVNTIGYREIIKYLDGELTLAESIELLKKNTRNYAKRQLTWFRRNNEIKWDVYPDKLSK